MSVNIIELNRDLIKDVHKDFIFFSVEETLNVPRDKEEYELVNA